MHIPKTGGMSIDHVFDRAGWNISYNSGIINDPYYSKILNPQGSLLHLTYNELAMSLDIADFDFVFTVVRNPYERVISEYHWQHCTRNFNTWFKEEIQNTTKISQYKDNHFCPQIEYVGKHTDAVYNLEQGFTNIVNDLETRLNTVFAQKTFHANISNKTINLDDIDKQLVYNAYKQDFERFGYDTTS